MRTRDQVRRIALRAIAALALFTTIAATAAGPAMAGKRERIVGETSAGRAFAGWFWTETRATGRVCVAEIALHGVGTRRLEAPAPGDGPVSKLVVNERATARGAAGSLGALLTEDHAEGQIAFELVPVLGHDDERASPGHDEAEDASPRSTPPTLEIVWDGGDLVAEGAQVLVGERLALVARVVRNGEVLDSGELLHVRWEVRGAAIKSYRHDVVGDPLWQVRALPGGSAAHAGRVETTVEPLLASSLASPRLAFYWTAEGGREVRVRARTRSGEVLRARVDLSVRRSAQPARDLYAIGTVSANWSVRDEHQRWHDRHEGGDRFVAFHRELLRAYDDWRSIFGYAPVRARGDASLPGGGVDRPSWFTEEGGDASSPVRGRAALGEFQTLSELGDDLEHWCALGLLAESERRVGDDPESWRIADPWQGPTHAAFYAWLRAVDDVAREWEWLDAASAPRHIPASIDWRDSTFDFANRPDRGNTMRLVGEMPLGAELLEIRITRRRHDAPPLEVFEIVALATPGDPAFGRVGTERWSEEVDLGRLPVGRYLLRFNAEELRFTRGIRIDEVPIEGRVELVLEGARARAAFGDANLAFVLVEGRRVVLLAEPGTSFGDEQRLIVGRGAAVDGAGLVRVTDPDTLRRIDAILPVDAAFQLAGTVQLAPLSADRVHARIQKLIRSGVRRHSERTRLAAFIGGNLWRWSALGSPNLLEQWFAANEPELGEIIARARALGRAETPLEVYSEERETAAIQEVLAELVR